MRYVKWGYGDSYEDFFLRMLVMVAITAVKDI